VRWVPIDQIASLDVRAEVASLAAAALTVAA
jgi:hypothetical protein